MSWRYVDIEEVYYIHEAVIKKAGTKASVRDFALLHSAVERPKATFAGKDLYPTIFLKAASLLQSLCLNHPFTDGNKRTSLFSAVLFLEYNGYTVKFTKKEAIEFTLKAHNDDWAVEQIAGWIKKHTK